MNGVLEFSTLAGTIVKQSFWRAGVRSSVRIKFVLKDNDLSIPICRSVGTLPNVILIVHYNTQLCTTHWSKPRLNLR